MIFPFGCSESFLGQFLHLLWTVLWYIVDRFHSFPLRNTERLLVQKQGVGALERLLDAPNRGHLLLSAKLGPNCNFRTLWISKPEKIEPWAIMFYSPHHHITTCWPPIRICNCKELLIEVILMRAILNAIGASRSSLHASPSSTESRFAKLQSLHRGAGGFERHFSKELSLWGTFLLTPCVETIQFFRAAGHGEKHHLASCLPNINFNCELNKHHLRAKGGYAMRSGTNDCNKVTGPTLQALGDLFVKWFLGFVHFRNFLSQTFRMTHCKGNNIEALAFGNQKILLTFQLAKEPAWCKLGQDHVHIRWTNGFCWSWSSWSIPLWPVGPKLDMSKMPRPSTNSAQVVMTHRHRQRQAEIER